MDGGSSVTTSEPTTCKAWKENTTGFRKDVWDQFDSKKDADLNRCKICGHEYFSDDNWDSIDPHTVEYAEHLNHHTRLILELKEKNRALEEERDGLRAIVHEETLWLTEYHTSPLPGSDETCPACLLVSRAATALARHAQDGLAPIPPSDRRGEGK